jgi:hypothetical protein
VTLIEPGPPDRPAVIDRLAFEPDATLIRPVPVMLPLAERTTGAFDAISDALSWMLPFVLVSVRPLLLEAARSDGTMMLPPDSTSIAPAALNTAPTVRFAAEPFRIRSGVFT